MNNLFADRILGVAPSFIREILKVSQDPQIISFAGGLPSKALFPVQEIKEATEKVFATYGSDCLQYGNSEDNRKNSR